MWYSTACGNKNDFVRNKYDATNLNTYNKVLLLKLMIFITLNVHRKIGEIRNKSHLFECVWKFTLFFINSLLIFVYSYYYSNSLFNNNN